MARSLKTKGMEELNDLRRRIDRQYSLKRIGKRDWQRLKKHADILAATIIEMREFNEQGVEEGETEW